MMAAMTDDVATLLGDRDAWDGGFYELAIWLGAPDDAILQTATRALLGAAGIDTLWRNAPKHPQRIEGDTWTLQPDTGHLSGLVELPSGRSVICGVMAIRYERDDDWLYLDLPLAALRRLDARIGLYPLVGADVSSLAWRKPLDNWLAQIAVEVRRAVSFKLALIGWEVDEDGISVANPRQKGCWVSVVTADGTYLPATC